MTIKLFIFLCLFLISFPENAAQACEHKERDFSEMNDSKARKYARRDAEMKMIDTDCDGKLQEEELKNSIARNFTRYDSDADGFLSPQETQKILENIALLYEDLITTKILEKQIRKMRNKIRIMDRDRDDKISKDEYEKHYNKRYAKLDKNGDKTLDIIEFENETQSSGN